MGPVGELPDEILSQILQRTDPSDREAIRAVSSRFRRIASAPGFPGDEEVNERVQRAFDRYVEGMPNGALQIVNAWITGSDRARLHEVSEVLQRISASKLDLTSYAITDSIVDLILQQRDLTELSLSEVTSQQLAKIATLPKLRSLEFSCSVSELPKSIVFPSLVKLKISGKGERESGLELFFEKHPHLRMVSISDILLSEKTVRFILSEMKELSSLTLRRAAIADDALPFLKKIPQRICYLDLSGNHLTSLKEALARLKKLRVLILSENPLNWTNMAAPLRALKEMRRFEIAATNAGEEIVRAMIGWIHLNRLDVSGNPLMKSELEDILRTNRGFESLSLSGLNLTDQEMPLLVGQIRLRSLNLSRNQLTGSAIEVIRPLIPRLKELNLSGNFIGAGISSLFKNGITLEKLSLKECGLNGEAVAEILIALVGRKSLKEVDLRGNGASHRFLEIKKHLSIPDLRLPEYSLDQGWRGLWQLFRLRGVSEDWGA